MARSHARSTAAVRAGSEDTGLETFPDTCRGVAEGLGLWADGWEVFRSADSGTQTVQVPAPSHSGYGEYPEHLARGVVRASINSGSVVTGREIAEENRDVWSGYVRDDSGEADRHRFRKVVMLVSGVQSETAVVLATDRFGAVSESQDMALQDFNDGLQRTGVQAKSCPTLRSGFGDDKVPEGYGVRKDGDGVFIITTPGDRPEIPVFAVARDGRGNVMMDRHYGRARGAALESMLEPLPERYEYDANWRVYNAEAAIEPNGKNDRPTWDGDGKYAVMERLDGE